jgi:hypothetical protein
MTDAAIAAPNLDTLKLADLGQFTAAGIIPPKASPDFVLMFAGTDRIHEALKYILSGVRRSLKLNMFGYDDEELNAILMAKVKDPDVLVSITLDKSQAGGVHEKRLLESDAAKDPVGFSTHFVLGQSATHQISHTKGFVADGKVGAEGSTNWSASGEGTFVVKGSAGGVGDRAQNNTQSVFTDPDAVARFQAELLAEHMAARHGAASTRKPKSGASK